MPVMWEYLDKKENSSEWTEGQYTHDGGTIKVTKKQLNSLLLAQQQTHAITIVRRMPEEVMQHFFHWIEMLENPD